MMKVRGRQVAELRQRLRSNPINFVQASNKIEMELGAVK